MAKSAAGAPRRALRELADRVGIIADYVDQSGAEIRHTSDTTREALLAAIGLEASSEDAARRALAHMDDAARERPLEAVRVVRAGKQPPAVLARLPRGWSGAIQWHAELVTEEGVTHERSGRAGSAWSGTVRVPVPAVLPPGYHTLRISLRRGDQESASEQSFIVAPDTCPTPATVLGGRRVFGLIANLYTVRSGRNWGAGDLTDLGEILEFTADVGGAFVGVNPLHALRNRGDEISPYSPVSRLFRNLLYIDPEAVPELPHASAARELLDSEDARAERARLRGTDSVEYEQIMRLKLPVLEALYAAFVRHHRGRDTARERAFLEYVESQGEPLRDYATFCAIEEELARGVTEARRPASWRQWPAPLREPHSREARAFRAANAERVDFHRYLQFELDRQLGAAAARARARGMPIGVYQDLAIGTSPNGCDVWMYPHLFVERASIGAPPDMYSKSGQNWGLPAMNPHALRDERYAYWIALVRSALRHAGAIRIDHVIGLFRQFWIPAGQTGSEGAYVRFPTDDLLGILALESTRAGALVVGEDLGTVPREVPGGLRRWGILGSKVLYFERRERGGYRAAARYEPMALTTANTHDMPTLAGFWTGRDIEVKRQVGLLAEDEEVERARATRAAERSDLVRLLVAERLLPKGAEPASTLELRSAVHAFLRRTSSALVGLALDDVAGEVEPVNVPGVGPDQFPSWTRRMRRTIESLRSDPDVHRALGAERAWVPPDRSDDGRA